MSFLVVIVPVGTVHMSEEHRGDWRSWPTAGYIATTLERELDALPNGGDFVGLYPDLMKELNDWHQEYWQAAIDVVGNDCDLRLQYYEAFVFDKGEYKHANLHGGKFNRESGDVRYFVKVDQNDANRHELMFRKEINGGALFTPWGEKMASPLAHYRFDGSIALEAPLAG